MQKFHNSILLAGIAFLLLISGKSFASNSELDLLTPSNRFSSIFSGHDTLKLNGAYLKSYWTCSKHIVASPFHWNGKQWLTAGLILGGTAALYPADQAIKDFTQANHNKYADILFTGAEVFGNPSYTIPFLALNYAYGTIFKDQTAKNVSLLGLQSLAISAGFVYILKMGTQRHRPWTGDPYNTWDGPAFSLKYTSFPSGHSSSAWSIATTIALEFKGHPYIPAIAYSIASITALSRVYENYHWSSDIFLGSAIGFFTAQAVHRFHHGGTNENLSIVPSVGTGFNGLSLSYRF